MLLKLFEFGTESIYSTKAEGYIQNIFKVNNCKIKLYMSHDQWLKKVLLNPM
jgi:hypothetical protein